MERCNITNLKSRNYLEEKFGLNGFPILSLDCIFCGVEHHLWSYALFSNDDVHEAPLMQVVGWQDVCNHFGFDRL